MKKIFSISILVLIFHIIPCQLFSQNQNKTINAETSWNGRMCNGGHGICYIDNSLNKSTTNTQVS